MSIKKRVTGLVLALALLASILPLSNIISFASFTGALQFDQNGKFTVMQVADIQDDQSVESRVIQVLTKAIQRYSPDLVVFTGDNVIETISSNANFRSSVNGFLAPLLNTNTKFAVTFGNHDDEGSGAPSKTDQYNYYKSVGGNNFVDHDVAALSGVGSGAIPIYPYGQTSGTPAFQVYVMDSGSDPSSGSYDCCYTNQIDYYIQRSQTYPDVPSLWFQHVIVPDIYTRTMTTSTTGVSFTGKGSPFSGNSWSLDPAKINWARSSSTVLSDIYCEAPCPPNQSLYESAAHRSSSTYGSKTLYESWVAYGNLLGAYFGHDHLNEFVMTTSDGIDLGYGESTGLYSTLGLIDYNDDNPGVSIYTLDAGGTYASEFVDESDLNAPPVDPSIPSGQWRVYAATTDNGTEYGVDNGTYDNVYLRIYSGDNATGTMLYQSAPLVGVNTGGANGNITPIVPTTNQIRSLQIILPSGDDQWGCAQVQVFYTPAGGTEQLIWNFDPDEKSFDSGTSVTQNVSWFQTNNHTITFNGNGATGGSTEGMNLVWGTSDTLTPNGFYKTGYKFAGWATSSSGAVAYANEATYTMGTSNVTLYAKWTPNTYTVMYDGNDAVGGTTASSSHTYDTAKALTANGFYKTGYSFAGWAVSSAGPAVYTNGQSVTNLTATDGVTVTLYAKWTPNNYTVIYGGNGSTGGTTANSLHTYDLASNLTLNGFTRTGHSFLGWSTVQSASSPSYTNGQSVQNLTTAPGGTVNFYAVWSVNTYQITFDASGGTGGYSAPMLYGAALSAPAVTKTGCTLTGWQPAVPSSVGAANATYTAQWSVNSYTVSFNGNGGTGSPSSVTQAYGSTVTLPMGFAKTGYTLLGWNTTAGATTALSSYTVPLGDSTLYAIYVINQYTVSFDANGGTGFTPPVTQPYGTSVALPTTGFSKTGYTFLGWNTTAYATTALTECTVPDGNVTLYAIYEADDYTITFDANGGTAVNPITGEYGNAVSEPAAPAKTGYTFNGWYADPGLLTPVAWPYTIGASNSTFYAKWTANTYTVSYDANNGDAGNTPASSHTYGIAANLTTNGFTKTGHSFLGWSTAAGGPAEYSDNQSVLNLTPVNNAMVTFYAVWAVNQYTVTFDANGGTGSASPVTLGYGAPVVLPQTGFGKTGHSLAGWNTSPEASVALNAYDVPDYDSVLYAVYTPNQYTIGFDANGGTGSVSPVTQLFGSPVALPTEGFAKTGYTFIGWNTVPGAAEALSGFSVPAADTTLYAVYTINQYTVSFDANGGTGSAAPVTQNFGTAVSLPAAGFAKTGYTFIGWNTEPGAAQALSGYTMPAQNETLYAVYAITQNTVSFDANGGEGYAPVVSLDYGSPVELPATGFSKTGHTFIGWNTDPAAVTAIASYTVPEGDSVLYAIYTINQYTVTFNANGGSGPVLQVTQDYGTAVELPALGYAKEGYTFLGWNTDPGATATLGSFSVPAEDTALYAVYAIAAYTITFDANGGEGGASALMTYGEPLAAPEVTRAGYTFTGWLPAVPATVPAGNATYTAQWSQNVVDLAVGLEKTESGFKVNITGQNESHRYQIWSWQKVTGDLVLDEESNVPANQWILSKAYTPVSGAVAEPDGSISFNIEPFTSPDSTYTIAVRIIDEDNAFVVELRDSFTPAEVQEVKITKVLVDGEYCKGEAIKEITAEASVLIEAVGNGLENTVYTAEIKETAEVLTAVNTNEFVWDVSALMPGRYTVALEASNGVSSDTRSIAIRLYAVDAGVQYGIIDDMGIEANAQAGLPAAAEITPAFANGEFVYKIREPGGSFLFESAKFTQTGVPITHEFTQYGIYDVYGYVNRSAADIEGAYDDGVIKTIKIARSGVASSYMNLTASPSVNDPIDKGTPVLFTAQAHIGGIGGTAVQYSFWRHDARGYALVRDWSADNTLNWTPARIGNYTIEARAKGADAGSYEAIARVNVTVTDDIEQIARDVTIGINEVYLNANARARIPIAIRASAVSSNSEDLLYKFYTYDDSMRVIMLQNYSANQECIWTPRKAGDYEIHVLVKNKASFGKCDAEAAFNVAVD